MSANIITDTSYVKGAPDSRQINGRLYNLMLDGQLQGPTGGSYIIDNINYSLSDPINGKTDIYALLKNNDTGQTLLQVEANNNHLLFVSNDGQIISTPNTISGYESAIMQFGDTNNLKIISNDSVNAQGTTGYFGPDSITLTSLKSNYQGRLVVSNIYTQLYHNNNNGDYSICEVNEGSSFLSAVNHNGNSTILNMTPTTVSLTGIPTISSDNTLLINSLNGNITQAPAYNVQLVGTGQHLFVTGGSSGTQNFRGLTATDGSITFTPSATDINLSITNPYGPNYGFSIGYDQTIAAVSTGFQGLTGGTLYNTGQFYDPNSMFNPAGFTVPYAGKWLITIGCNTQATPTIGCWSRLYNSTTPTNYNVNNYLFGNNLSTFTPILGQYFGTTSSNIIEMNTTDVFIPQILCYASSYPGTITFLLSMRYLGS
jgi:hypothetical protein